MKIPLIRPQLPNFKDLEVSYKEIQESGIYTNFGPKYEEACKKIQDKYQGYYPVLTNNGTTSIQAALQLTLPRGSRVAIPDFTFIATLNAVVSAGMIPVILDVCPDRLTISIESLMIHHERYDAFICVSPFGYYVDTVRYDELARDFGKKVVYDFAGAFGTGLNQTNNPVSFSLHATKNLPVGEGGLLLLSSQKQQETVKEIIGFNLDKKKIPKDQYGFNGKMDELHCSMVSAQLDTFDDSKDAWEISKEYFTSLKCIKREESTINIMSRGAPQLPVFRVKNIKKIIKKCTDAGISVRRYYFPLLSECRFKDVKILEKSKKMNDFLAFPKNVSKKEFKYIVKVVNS